MFKFIKLFIIISIFPLFTFLFIFVNFVYSADYTESFDGGLHNTTLWKTIRTTPEFDSDNSTEFAKILPIQNSNSFNYLRTIDLKLIKSDFTSLFLTSKFINSGNILQGSGYIISDNTPELHSSLNYNSLMFFIWPIYCSVYFLSIN